MRTTIHLHPQPDDFSAGHGGPGKYHPGYATVDMESGDVEAVIFLDSAAKCDALIKAAVEAKRLLLGDTIPPVLEQDLAAAEADPANPYGGTPLASLREREHYSTEGADDEAARVQEMYDEPSAHLTGHLPQHKGAHPECTAPGCGQPGHHLHAIEVPTRGMK